MSMSFIRGLTASVLSNFSNIKRQVKRLQKDSLRVVGRQLSIEECQELIAAINGYKKWADISEIAIRTSADRSQPFYRILSRSDFHEKILSGLIDCELELNDSKPLVFLGSQCHAAIPAYCLWLETISAQRNPGLILIETDKQAIQETELWSAISSLGLEEVTNRFRVIDTREKVLQVSISATPRGWVRSIAAILNPAERERFETSGAFYLLEKLISAYAHIGRWDGQNRGDAPSSCLEQALFFLANHHVLTQSLLVQMTDHESEHLKRDLEQYLPTLTEEVFLLLKKLYDSLRASEIGLGTVMWTETEYRPTIVLFNRANQLSEVIAGAIFECFYGRYVNLRATRPILYYSDIADKRLPNLLGFAGNSIICNGVNEKASEVWSEVLMGNALFGYVDASSLIFCGRKVALIAPTSAS
ncbi:hypothetical protein ICN48_07235 [Polynucleobacter sp. JS-Safj-400b-B2]|uniref:hypothetical protein n=1 Tax=Polynucleobacter sp. JS-Safj-400b-B2 TaxID=2576921 RepID=UPI001C0C4490|nr:hypothetical protein [Polynucleobacter sp. JS-Safj-400b-B2]MBU3626025.1 hypothetical protein [Polynucleobacter sp. JS-Safj-400b-B2]